MIFSYLKYLLKAGNRHGLHSPFVYELYDRVICEQKHYYAYEVMESLRARMLLSDEVIEVVDFGTGRQRYPQKRAVRFIASRFASPRKSAQLLFRLVNHFRPAVILEMGTSLGLTTGYLASASTGAEVVTLEGCPETARIASHNFRLLKLPNVTIHVGEFDETLPAVVGKLPHIDFAYLDGNHTYAATLRYFEELLPKIPAEGLLVIDDIHWSRDMEKAWGEIKKHERVTASIDLFEMGLVFFRPGLAGQHFTLKF